MILFVSISVTFHNPGSFSCAQMTCRFRAKLMEEVRLEEVKYFVEDLPGLVGSFDRLVLLKQNALLNLFFLVKTVLIFS